MLLGASIIGLALSGRLLLRALDGMDL